MPAFPTVNAITSGPQRTTKYISLPVKRRDVRISASRVPLRVVLFFRKYLTRTYAHADIASNVAAALRRYAVRLTLSMIYDNTFVMASMTLSGWNGFTMKSFAPAWIASMTIGC